MSAQADPLAVSLIVAAAGPALGLVVVLTLCRMMVRRKPQIYAGRQQKHGSQLKHGSLPLRPHLLVPGAVLLQSGMILLYYINTSADRFWQGDGVSPWASIAVLAVGLVYLLRRAETEPPATSHTTPTAVER